MRIAEVVAKVQELGIEIGPAGDKLRLKPIASVPPELLAEVKAQRDAILEHLRVCAGCYRVGPDQYMHPPRPSEEWEHEHPEHEPPAPVKPKPWGPRRNAFQKSPGCRYDWLPDYRGERLHCVTPEHDHKPGSDTVVLTNGGWHTCHVLHSLGMLTGQAYEDHIQTMMEAPLSTAAVQ